MPTGSVPIHMPATMTLIGNVASPGSGASIEPMMPVVATMTVLLPPASACATASTTALRAASRSSVRSSAGSATTAMVRLPVESSVLAGQRHAGLLPGGAGQKCKAPLWRITTERASSGVSAPSWPNAACVSSIRMSMTWLAPSSPSAPRPHKNALPANAAAAPSA